MTKPRTLEILKEREAALLKQLTDGSKKRQHKRHIKRALERVRKQIKEME